MKNVCKLNIEMNLGIILKLNKGTCLAGDGDLDVESEEFSIPDIFREEISYMGDLGSYVGDEKIDTVWITDLIKILEHYMITVEAHNSRIENLTTAFK